MGKKICLLIEKLNGGGAERSAGLLSTILINLNYEVVVITLYDDIAYPFSGELVNLGKYKNGSRFILNKFNRYKKLQIEIDKGQFELIIDFRMKDYPLREFLLNKMVFNTKIINMVRSYKLEWYLPNPKTISKYLYKDYAGINTVSLKIQKAIEEQYNFTNVNTIYNSIDINSVNLKANESVLIEDNYVIAVGRLDANKQFNKLLEAYSNSVLPEKNIKLYILGDGPEKDLLIDRIDDLNLINRVILIPFQKNPFKYISRSEFLVLSSKNEGFPRVLIESLACETPVISFDCNSGPSEIIQHEHNGLLIEDQNFVALKDAMNKMVLDSAFRNSCKANCLKSIDRLSLKNIEIQWKKYIEDVLLK